MKLSAVDVADIQYGYRNTQHQEATLTEYAYNKGRKDVLKALIHRLEGGSLAHSSELVSLLRAALEEETVVTEL